MLKADGKNKTVVVMPETDPSVLLPPLDGVKDTTNIVTEPTRTTVTDLSRTPKEYLLPYVEGSSWPLKAYYRRLLGKNDPKTLFDTKQDSPVQQFDKLVNLELRVTSPLARDQDTTNKLFTMTGTSTLVNSISPNEGDIIVASLGDGREGIFNVTNTTRKSNNKISTFEIEYTLLFENKPEYQSILDTCTVRTYYYVKERAWTGGDTLLSEKEYRQFLGIGEHLKAIEATYLRRFYNEDVQTVLYPDATYGLAYDVFLAQFIKDLGLRVVGKDIRIYPHPVKPLRDIETIYDAVIRQQDLFLSELVQDNRAFSTRSFRTMQTNNTVGWSKIVVTRYFSEHLPDGRKMPAEWPPFTAFTSPTYTLEGNGSTLPLFLPLTYNPYLFSQTFYDGSYSSVLEYGLRLYLTKQPLAGNIAIALAEGVRALPKDAQLYYTPFVYVLLKYSR